MKYLPSVTKAEYLTDYIISLTFDDGTKGDVDFSIWLSGDVFEPLRRKTFFKKFFLDGSTVTWPNGADIAPETLYNAAKNINNQKLDLTSNKRRKLA